MKNQKNVLLIGLIYSILLGVFNMLVFVIFKNHTSVFWISYTFMTLAFIVQIASMFLSFKKTDVDTIFFGIPLASLSIFYLIAELCVGTVFMTFQNVGTTIALVIQILILAGFVVIAIIALMARDTVQDLNDNVKQKVIKLKSIKVDIDILLESCADLELKAKLKKLTDTIKYSDPMTNDTVKDVEQRIDQKVSELRISCENSEIEEAKKTCSSLEMLYVERNKILLISK